MADRWRLWYADGTVSSDEAGWELAPAHGVQALVWWTDAGPTISYGVDEYRLPGQQAAKYGSEIDWEQHRQVIRAMLAEAAPELPDPFGG